VDSGETVGSGGRLSRGEFDEVIRRASELAAAESDSGRDLTEGELLRIAGEVGLPERHVRSALAELRSGDLAAMREQGLMEKIFGPSSVRAGRVVPGTPKELEPVIDEFLVAGQLLQRVRSRGEVLQYRPAVDWVSQIARAASSTSRRYYVASARSVDVTLSPSGREGQTLVEFEVDPGDRTEVVAWTAALDVAVGGGVGVGVGFVVATLGPLAVAIGAGAVTAGALAGGITWWGGRTHREKVREVREELAGVLDRLEAGEGLEPPPPSWRRWVERHFHGARRLLDDRSS
jgi:hypothetical protein